MEKCGEIWEAALHSKIMTEGNISIDFSQSLSAKKFDGDDHGLSHCMKAVDFIVELKDKIYFVEIKDPDHPNAKPNDRNEFVKKLESSELINELKYKYRDSYLYELAMKKVTKPVHYLVLICLDSLTETELTNRMDILKKDMPVDGPPRNHWPQKFVHGCIVMNLRTWNSHLPKFPASRISGSTSS